MALFIIIENLGYVLLLLHMGYKYKRVDVSTLRFLPYVICLGHICLVLFSCISIGVSFVCGRELNYLNCKFGSGIKALVRLHFVPVDILLCIQCLAV